MTSAIIDSNQMMLRMITSRLRFLFFAWTDRRVTIGFILYIIVKYTTGDFDRTKLWS